MENKVWMARDIEIALNMKLDDWQIEFITDNHPNLILCCGRKCGKTLALAVKIVLDAINNDFSRTDGILILSRGQRQSREVFLLVRAIVSKLGIALSPKPKPGEGYASMTLIVLPGGNKIYSLPSGFDGVTLRTYSFWKIYRDEDAFIPDAVDTAVSACLAVYGIQEVRASTPCGNSGSFYDAYHNPDYKRWHRTTLQCPRVTKHFLAKEKRRMTKAEFAQEYLAEFTELAEGIYQKVMIMACQQDWDMEKIRAECRAVFFGVDYARFGEDKNAIARAFLVGNKLYMTAEEVTSRWRTTEVNGKIKAMIRQENKFRVVVTDESGVGAGATDQLIEDLGKRKVIGLANQRREERGDGRPTRYLKVDMHTNLIRLMENGKVVLDDRIEIVRSLRSMTYKYTKNGELTISGRNNHIAEALVRAAFPLMQKKNYREPWIDFVPLSNPPPIFSPWAQ